MNYEHGLGTNKTVQQTDNTWQNKQYLQWDKQIIGQTICIFYLPRFLWKFRTLEFLNFFLIFDLRKYDNLEAENSHLWLRVKICLRIFFLNNKKVYIDRTNTEQTQKTSQWTWIKATINIQLFTFKNRNTVWKM